MRGAALNCGHARHLGGFRLDVTPSLTIPNMPDQSFRDAKFVCNFVRLMIFRKPVSNDWNIIFAQLRFVGLGAHCGNAPAFPRHVRNIFRLRSKLQMLNFNASRVIARVHNHVSVRYLSVFERPYQPMHELAFSMELYAAISVNS